VCAASETAGCRCRGFTSHTRNETRNGTTARCFLAGTLVRLLALPRKPATAPSLKQPKRPGVRFTSSETCDILKVVDESYSLCNAFVLPWFTHTSLTLAY